MPIKVAVQGQAGSFHDIAARKYFDGPIDLVPCRSFKNLFEAIESGEAGSGIVALENSLYGSIDAVYDLLLKYKFWIAGEVYLRIEQCLIGLPGASIEKVNEIWSQREALGQCEEYLDTVLKYANRVEFHDTAASVAEIKKLGNPAKAAIASRAAADLYSMQVLANEIETHKQNYTRFVALTKLPDENSKANKTSVVLGIADQTLGIGDTPGALYHALGAFAKQDINLTKLQSRPLIGKAWHYIFYADVDSGLQDPKMQNALYDLRKQQCEVTILGSYVSGR
jgi:prephenate dehydratase